MQSFVITQPSLAEFSTLSSCGEGGDDDKSQEKEDKGGRARTGYRVSTIVQLSTFVPFMKAKTIITAE